MGARVPGSAPAKREKRARAQVLRFVCRLIVRRWPSLSTHGQPLPERLRRAHPVPARGHRALPGSPRRRRRPAPHPHQPHRTRPAGRATANHRAPGDRPGRSAGRDDAHGEPPPLEAAIAARSDVFTVHSDIAELNPNRGGGDTVDPPCFALFVTRRRAGVRNCPERPTPEMAGTAPRAGTHGGTCLRSPFRPPGRINVRPNRLRKPATPDRERSGRCGRSILRPVRSAWYRPGVTGPAAGGARPGPALRRRLRAAPAGRCAAGCRRAIGSGGRVPRARPEPLERPSTRLPDLTKHAQQRPRPPLQRHDCDRPLTVLQRVHPRASLALGRLRPRRVLPRLHPLDALPQ